MIIKTRTPLRVSFLGGGTDLREYYQHDFGCVISTAIKKYMYVIVKPYFFEDTYRLSYMKDEFVKTIGEIQHPIIREAFRMLDIKPGIEVFCFADIPSSGTGLGSSSSFAVGLLNALHAYKHEYKSQEEIAQEACKIEIEILKEPIGKQDQYAAAYGSINFIQFNKDERTIVEPINLTVEKKKELQENLLCFYTGITRKAGDILSEQKAQTMSKKEFLDKMKNLALQFKKEIGNNQIENLGKYLHESWQLKRQLASKISNPAIDEMYEKAIAAGAEGGKLLGAGGGGFMLFYCKKENQENVRNALKEFKEEKIAIENSGTKISYIDNY